MSGKTQDAEFRHPEAVAFLESLTTEQAAKQPPLILEQDGVVARQRREDGHVRCREFETDGVSGGRSFEMDALHAAVEAEFGRSLPRLEAELRVGGVLDLDAIETSIRERARDLGARTCADLLEARDAADPPPPGADRPMCWPSAAPINRVSAAPGRRGLGAGPCPPSAAGSEMRK